MPRGRPKGSRNAIHKEKKTPCKIRPIERKHAGKATEPWTVMERLIEEVSHFADLKVAKWALLWRKDWKPDIDGVTTLAMIRRASEFDRTLLGQTLADGLDLVLLLAESAWQGMTAEDRERMIFHVLCHPKAARDSNGNQKMDTRDRLQWRLRKHPIVAFHEEIDAYGIDSILKAGERAATAARHAERPMEKTFDAAEAVEEAVTKVAEGNAEEVAGTDDNPQIVDPNAWKRMSVKVLKLKPVLQMKLVDAGLKTLERLSAHIASRGDEWDRAPGILGVGEAGAEQIRVAYVIFWAAHPEFCRPETDHA